MFHLYQIVVVRRDIPMIQVPVQGGHAGQATALATWPGDKDYMLRLLGGNDTYDLKFENVPAFKEAAV